MWSRPESDEALVRRLLPSSNPNRPDRASAWAEWQSTVGEAAVLKFIRTYNNTPEPDEDILQDAMLTAYLEVEHNRYEPRFGVPFTAYVKGIARNKIREARRRSRRWVGLDEAPPHAITSPVRQLESWVENREACEAVSQGLLRLPAQRRQVLECYITGETTGEIASRFAVTEEAVRQHKSRGLRSLRELCGARQ